MSLVGDHHVHPRPRGDVVLCDGCRKPLPLVCEADAARADELAILSGWLVTTSMLRSFHFCPNCKERR